MNLYKQIRAATESEQAAIAVLQELGKMQRALLYQQAGRPISRNGNEPASDSQLSYLKRLGVKVEGALDRRTASRMIDEVRLKNGR